MPAAAARHDGHLGRAVFAVDDFVGNVALHRGVGVRDAEQGRVDEVGGVMDEVFGCGVLFSLDMFSDNGSFLGIFFEYSREGVAYPTCLLFIFLYALTCASQDQRSSIQSIQTTNMEITRLRTRRDDETKVKARSRSQETSGDPSPFSFLLQTINRRLTKSVCPSVPQGKQSPSRRRASASAIPGYHDV